LKLSDLGELLREGIPLVCVIVGVLLVFVSMGPFSNPDTRLEYTATLAVILKGKPTTVLCRSSLIDQPPLGFYFSALILKAVGALYDNAVAITTFFGLGCTLLVYALGKVLYGKLTAVFAAALFALTPWHSILSRSYLIDVPCLFYSLLCLLVGVYAIRRDSFKLFMASGIIFAIAVLTKIYAVYALVPLAVFYGLFRQRRLGKIFVWLPYFVPAAVLSVYWYEIATDMGLLFVFRHQDLHIPNPEYVTGSIFFVGNFLLRSLGFLFLPAALGFLVALLGRKHFPRNFSANLLCLITIIIVVGVNVFLGLGLNLYAPYHNPVKYEYQSLPFFCMMAASLVNKNFIISNPSGLKQSRLTHFLALSGVVLLTVSTVLNILFIHVFSMTNNAVFSVEFSRDTGYTLGNMAPNGLNSSRTHIQFIGFSLIVAGLVWAIINQSQFPTPKQATTETELTQKQLIIK